MKKFLSMTLALLMMGALLTGCGDKDSAANVDLSGVAEDIASAYGENWLADTTMTEEMFKQEFPLDASLVQSFVAKMPMIGFHPDRVVLIKATKGNGAKVEEKLNEIKEEKIQNEMQYPSNIAKVQATQVVRQGDYVAFLLVGAIDEVNLDDEKAALNYAKEQVQIAVDTFNGAFK